MYKHTHTQTHTSTQSRGGGYAEGRTSLKSPEWGGARCVLSSWKTAGVDWELRNKGIQGPYVPSKTKPFILRSVVTIKHQSHTF